MKLIKWHKWRKKQKIAFGLILGILVLVNLLIIYELNLFKFGADVGDAVTLSFSNVTNQPVNSEFTVNINLSPNGNNVCSIRSDINFTPSSVNVVSMNISASDPNGNPSDPTKPFVFSFPKESFDNSQGVAHTTLGAPGCTTSDVLVYSVTFKAVGEGINTLDFTNVKVMTALSPEDIAEVGSNNNSTSFTIGSFTTSNSEPVIITKKSSTPSATSTPTPSNTTQQTPTETSIVPENNSTPESSNNTSTQTTTSRPTSGSTPASSSGPKTTSTPQVTNSFDDSLTQTPISTPEATSTKKNTGLNWKLIIAIIIGALLLTEVVIFFVLRNKKQ